MAAGLKRDVARAVLVCALAAAAGLLLPAGRAAADCLTCGPDIDAYNQLLESKRKSEDLLKRNREYLAAYGARFPSQGIKAKSNILIIELKLETARNNLKGAGEELARKGCSKCR